MTRCGPPCLNVCNSILSALEKECNREMRKLHKWYCANKLQINPENSEAIIILSKLFAPKTDLSITYHDSPINCKKTLNLSVKLEFKLKYKPLITLLVENKVARLFGILSKLSYLFPSFNLLLLYYLFIHFHLLFGLPLWENTNPTYLTELPLQLLI